MVTHIAIASGTTWALRFGRIGNLPDGRRDGDAHGLKHLAACPETLAANGKLFAVFFDGDFLQCLEVLLYVRPFETGMAGGFEPSVEFFSQDECKEAAKDVSAYGFIALMENGSCEEDGFHVPECVLHHPELLVFQRNIFGGQSGIGPEDPYAIIFGFLLDFFHVD